MILDWGVMGGVKGGLYMFDLVGLWELLFGLGIYLI